MKFDSPSFIYTRSMRRQPFFLSETSFPGETKEEEIWFKQVVFVFQTSGAHFGHGSSSYSVGTKDGTRIFNRTTHFERILPLESFVKRSEAMVIGKSGIIEVRGMEYGFPKTLPKDRSSRRSDMTIFGTVNNNLLCFFLHQMISSYPGLPVN